MKRNILLILLSSVLLTSCFNNANTYFKEHYILPLTTNNNELIFPLNTSVYIISNNKNLENKEKEIFDQFDNDIYSIHKDVDAYHNYDDVNGINIINQNYGNKDGVIISSNLKDLIKESIKLTKLTKGRFNLTLGELIDTWKPYFDKNEKYQDKPSIETINASLRKQIPYEELDDYIKIDDEINKTVFKKYKDIDSIKLNLGAIAKGYALSVASKNLLEGSYILSAGSSSLSLIGENNRSNDTSYSLSITSPSLDGIKDSLMHVKAYKDESVSTSGDYEKYFIDKKDGKIYSHILNKDTGYSSSSYSLVNVISKCPAYVLDALSTALMNENDLDQASKMIKDFEITYNKKIDYSFINRSFDKYNVTCSKGYASRIKDKKDDKISNFVILDNTN